MFSATLSSSDKEFKLEKEINSWDFFHWNNETILMLTIKRLKRAQN